MKILYNSAKISELTIHHVGNPSTEDQTVLSDHMVYIENQEIEKALLNHFFEITKTLELWKFDDRFSDHPLHEDVDKMFNEDSNFMECSGDIANFLTKQSNHPQIKSGELIVAKISDVLLDDELVEVVCLFKMETQKRMFRIDRESGKAELSLLYGFDPKQIDKACLIFKVEEQDGYRICVRDKSSSTGDAKFWMGDFLRIKRHADDYYQTEGVIEATRYFVHNHLKPTYDMDKTDEAHIMARSKNYLQSKDKYDTESYASDVFEADEIAGQFRTYQSEYNLDSGNEVSEEFAIHPAAVKKQNRFFKSVLKLDKNFHVYVHGDRSRIRKGVDDTGRKYYMLFFDEES